jgi:hypothetical protein
MSKMTIRIILTLVALTTLGVLVWRMSCDCGERAASTSAGVVVTPTAAPAPAAPDGTPAAVEPEPEPEKPVVPPPELCRRFYAATKDHERIMTHIRLRPIQSFRHAAADNATAIEAGAAAIKALDIRHDELGPAFIEYRLVLEGMARDYRRYDDRPADADPLPDSEIRKTVKRNDLNWQVPWSTIEAICQPILHGG